MRRSIVSSEFFFTLSVPERTRNILSFSSITCEPTNTCTGSSLARRFSLSLTITHCNRAHSATSSTTHPPWNPGSTFLRDRFNPYQTSFTRLLLSHCICGERRQASKQSGGFFGLSLPAARTRGASSDSILSALGVCYF